MLALITWWTQDVRDVAPNAPDHDVVARAGAALLARWNEPARRYHTTTHLLEMFSALAELARAREIDDRQCSVARLAAWFHDAVYDTTTREGANEAGSAVLARDTLSRLRLDHEDIDAIDRLIRLTARHDADACEPLDAAFQDADLWILSAPSTRFDGYCDQVRQEYAHVPDEDYQNGRSAVLAPLMHRERIYRTSHALQAWETPARINLSRELARLRSDHKPRDRATR